jgi:hypothetical protein
MAKLACVLTVLLALGLAGCTTYDTQLHNPSTGQKMTCKESGWGLIGGAIATTQHNNCVHDAVAMGFSE